MMQVNGDCVNILTQKRKTHAICQSNSLFRVCHVCYFDLLYLYITVIHSHIYIYMEGVWCGRGQSFEPQKGRGRGN